jgi:hypothetical protein
VTHDQRGNDRGLGGWDHQRELLDSERRLSQLV